MFSSGLGASELLVIILVVVVLFAPGLAAFGLGWFFGSRSGQNRAREASQDVAPANTVGPTELEEPESPEEHAADDTPESPDPADVGEDAPSDD